MSRFSERASIASVLSAVLVSCVALTSSGCKELEGRNRTRQANRLFRETQFIEASAEYQKALKTVDDPIIHYNLGLAYSKVFKPGFDQPVLLGVAGDFVCSEIPGVKTVQAGACVKHGDRHFAECGASKTAPLEKQIAELEAQAKDATTPEDKRHELESQIKDKKDELNRYICASSFQCVEGDFCALSSPELAELAAQNFQSWIKAQPSDEDIKKKLAEASKELEEAKKSDNKSRQSEAQKEFDELSTKDQTRKLMTQLWIDSEQYQKALDYWEGLLAQRPNDPEIMSTLAGINLKAGNWRKSIEWYTKVADVTADTTGKVASYQFIGNVAWSKLNSRTLPGSDAVELADRGLGALQRAAELQPKNPRLTGLQASILNFRSTAHGASFAGAIERANAQDLLAFTRVLSNEAKKAQGLPVTPDPSKPAEAAGSASGSAAGSGSATGSAAGSAAAGSAAPKSDGSAAPATPATPTPPTPPTPAAPAQGSAAPAATDTPAAPAAAPAAGSGSTEKSGG